MELKHISAFAQVALSIPKGAIRETIAKKPCDYSICKIALIKRKSHFSTNPESSSCLRH